MKSTHTLITLTLALGALVFSPVSARPQEDCAEHSEGNAAQPASAQAQSSEVKKVIKRGAPLSQGERVSLDDVAADPERFADKDVLVTGTVSAVCQAKGCWMTLAGEKPTSRARVTFKDYAFFAPKDAKGMHVVLEGKVKVKVMGEAERKHLAEDGRVSVDQIPKAELRLVASGVELHAR